MTRFRIGIDVGGTFTDLVARDAEGRETFTKSPSTPEDQSVGVIAGLEKLARLHHLDLRDFLSRTDQIVHGTTVATNALLERKGARVGLLTTEGHRDVLEMREGLKPDRYNLRMAPTEPLVPRRLRRPVRERLRPDGSVETALDEPSVHEALRLFQADGVTSVAVCYLHSYRNPAHERATREILTREMPGAFVTLSSDVLPQIKEFERISTTVVNAYVGPAVSRYLSHLERRLKEGGLAGPLFVILSQGGMGPIEEAGRFAVKTVLSGPAGGIEGARRCARELATPDLLAFDMGGTSTDVSLIADGQAMLSSDGGLADQRIALRSLDIVSIGAGGGSIAYRDAGGLFAVGPRSAGARPGPACYGWGGTEPTVTDANLSLGYLDATDILGGDRGLDHEAARGAVARLGEQLGLSEETVAAGIHRLINVKMADGIRLVTVKRGVDPRRFALLSFGGAAGLHAVEVARELEMSRVIVPTTASVLSAWGMLSSDLSYEVRKTHIGDLGAMDERRLRAVFADLERSATERLAQWGEDDVTIRRSAEMRYGEQIYEIDVSLEDLDWEAPGLMERIACRFHASHEDRFTYSSPHQEVVLVNACATAFARRSEPATSSAMRVVKTDANPPQVVNTRRAFLGAWTDVPVHATRDLAPGQAVSGPALIESGSTTVLLRPGDTARVDERGWLDIAVDLPPLAIF
jgi:N-methylhydantoinase A